MESSEISKQITEIKSSVQYDMLTPELKVLIELYMEREKGLYVNELARMLKGHLSKASIEKSLMRLDEQGLIKSDLRFIDLSGKKRIVRMCHISGELTANYLENLINAIYKSAR